MSWPAVLAAFLACHLAGDFLLQTEWQALTKVQGLRTGPGRSALAKHSFTYLLAFVPALIWVANDRSVLRAVEVALLIAAPHVLVDDGRFVRGWLREVKHAPDPSPPLAIMVDQSFHVLCLLGAALVAAS